MYNSNYLRAYDRALHSSPVASEHQTWSIVSVDRQAFKQPPKLGGQFVIQGTLKESGDAYEIWDMEMKGSDNAESAEYNIVYNTAEGVRTERPSESSTSPSDLSLAWLPSPPLLSDMSGSLLTINKSFQHSFTTFRDEYDSHLSGCLPLRNMLNLMERTRSMALGGPHVLHRLQTEYSLLFVVSKCQHLSLVGQSAAESGTQYSKTLDCIMQAGQPVHVDTQVSVKRKGMILDFYHTVHIEASHTTIQANGQGDDIAKSETTRRRVAQGVVSLVTIDERTRKPTNKLPLWLLELLGVQ
jgi:hypothetical protein